jgi:predicted O-methyltransferase YrrM
VQNNVLNIDGARRPPHHDGYDFSEDWFSHHIPSFARILTQLRPTRLLEIGCYEGRATSYLIEQCAAFGAVQIHCVDTWQGSVDLSTERMDGAEQRFDHNVATAVSRAAADVALRKIRQRSDTALAGLITERADPFDLIYIDGSHTAADVMTDAVMAFQLLRVGGVMIFDDYLWSMEPPHAADPLNAPKLAIDAFTVAFARKVRVLPTFPNEQCYVEKIGN